jgi:hypothetical protein
VKAFEYNWRLPGLLAGLLLCVAGPIVVQAQDYAIDWWTVDGGGDMWTVGGDYELSGTIGQSDAGPVMSGGDYELVGGFWPGAVGPQYAPGDMNCDGHVNFDDIDAFVIALTGQAAYETAYPDCAWLNGDCDDDGAVTFDDIDCFVGLLSGGS